MLTTVAHDQRWSDVVAEISARFSKFAFVLFCYITNHLMTGPNGNNEFCFPRISISSRETLRFYLYKIHCSHRGQSLSVNYYIWDSLWKISLVESIQSIHNSLWTWHDKCNICCRCCIYHVKFNVCLVTKPLGVFSSETKWLNASLLFLRIN